ncbi:hypothetical protein B2K_39945 [Paenibacillus mucilaginosus K02]|uniref:Uncharacterized protein n=1 Tax=Paenibacillus mucilaginosus K02 TaxID=997761 RepID=R9UPK2_9BACL|nr:hypothetical protein B2K_39945 [Paenibacillus mucilaginosus K02]
MENEREAGVLLDKKKREKQLGKRQSGSPAGQGENSGTEMR